MIRGAALSFLAAGLAVFLLPSQAGAPTLRAASVRESAPPSTVVVEVVVTGTGPVGIGWTAGGVAGVARVTSGVWRHRFTFLDGPGVVTVRAATGSRSRAATVAVELPGLRCEATGPGAAVVCMSGVAS